MLSKRTKYGIKALTYLARKSAGLPIQVHTIAEEENISHKFLEAIMISLKKAGILQSKKGKGGGYLLNEDPTSITMEKVIRILEGPIAMLPCVSLNFYERCSDCPDERICSLNSLMLEVRDSTLNVLRNKTLHDLVAQ